MLTLDQLRANATFPTDELLELRDAIITQVRERLVMRQIMSIRQVPASAQEYGYDRIKTEFAGAAVVGKGSNFPRDRYDTERIKLTIFKIGDGFTIPREDYIAGQWRTQSLEQMVRRIAEKEDGFILDGDADLAPNAGALDFAGNTRADGIAGGWPAGTPNQIYDEIRQTLALLEADKFGGPYTAVVPVARMSDLRKFDTTSQRTALELVTGDPGLVSTLLPSFASPVGTVLFLQAGSDIAELVMAEDLTVEEPQYMVSNQRWEGNVYERFVPVFYQYGTVAGKSDALATLTSTDA